jgi:hypothetical protein
MSNGTGTSTPTTSGTGSSSLDQALAGLQALLKEEALFTINFIKDTNPQQVAISSSHNASTKG